MYWALSSKKNTSEILWMDKFHLNQQLVGGLSRYSYGCEHITRVGFWIDFAKDIKQSTTHSLHNSTSGLYGLVPILAIDKVGKADK